MADKSWPTCRNCNGHGTITQELAITIAQTEPRNWPGPGGIKGDTCAACNGAGRVPDPSWPVDAVFGPLSPEAVETIKAQLEADQATLGAVRERVGQFQAALKAAARR